MSSDNNTEGLAAPQISESIRESFEISSILPPLHEIVDLSGAHKRRRNPSADRDDSRKIEPKISPHQINAEATIEAYRQTLEDLKHFVFG
mgnify:CR=1 FL=1